MNTILIAIAMRFTILTSQLYYVYYNFIAGNLVLLCQSIASVCNVYKCNEGIKMKMEMETIFSKWLTSCVFLYIFLLDSVT